jgi:hypothetical protein
MRFAFAVADRTTHHVEFFRNPIWGTTWIAVDGRIVVGRSASELATHFNFEFVKHYTFCVGSCEVTIEHKRPLSFPGFRPHDYRVFVNGQLFERHAGY